MMTTRIPMALRREVCERANSCCEYCLLHQSLCASTHQVDHVIAEKHGGPTTLTNLALSCFTCNLRKSSDIASIDPVTGKIVGLFNPREQVWTNHFQCVDAIIVGVTPEGRTTVEFLQLNSPVRLVEREAFIKAGVYLPKIDTRKPK